MTAAIELVENPTLAIEDITNQTQFRANWSQDELQIFGINKADMDELFIKVYNAGTTYDSIDPDTKKVTQEVVITGKGSGPRTYIDNIRASVIDASIEDSIDATPSFSLTIHDPDWELLNTGALAHTIDINPGGVPGRWYRLQTIDVADDDITLTFLTRNAVYLSYHNKPYKVSRNKMTRAQFIKSLLAHVKKKGVKIKLVCPELDKKQPIAKTKPASKRSVNARRGQGFEDGVKLNFTGNDGSVHHMDEHNLKIADAVLRACEHLGASPRVMVGTLMVVSIETDFGNNTKNPTYIGVFQQNPLWWAATGDPYKDAIGARGKAGFVPGFMKLVNANPTADLGKLCKTYQTHDIGNFGYDAKCDRARDNAEKIVKAWDGGIGSESDQSFVKSYEFMVGPPNGVRGENYLAATYRLAEEVQWSAFWVKDELHYISQDDLFKAKARARIRYHRTGLEEWTGPKAGVSATAESVSATWDRGRILQELGLSVRMQNWPAPVGSVVVFDEGGPMQGRWLVTNIRKSPYETLGDITLRKPMHEKSEPAHDMGTRPKNGGDTSPVDPGDIEGTPKDIIDNVVIPIANSISDGFMAGGGTGRLTPAHVEAANHGHNTYTTSGNRSDHAGPPWYSWAADMSDNWGSSSGSHNMDKLAAELGRIFKISPHRGNCYSSQRGRYRFQICYMTLVGGNHFNHVHFGVRDMHASISTPPSYSPKQAHGGPARD